MKYRLAALAFAVFALAILGAVEAKEGRPLTSKITGLDSDDSRTAQILKCKDDSQSMSACRSFIKGFIQGALLTDAAIIESITLAETTYAERALRTRLGNRGGRSATELAGFCLPAHRTILELAEETLEHVKNAERNSEQLAKKVYQSLKIDYPCDS